MNVITATFDKTIKEFLREKSVLFWTILWPIIWVFIDCFVFVNGAPKKVIPYIKGSITISMMTFALTLAGMANLPGNISRDRERGLLTKLKSMPVSPWKDFVGRILGLVTFSCLASILVILAGIACGARFSGTIISVFQCIIFFLIIFFASAGIGLIIGTIVKHVHGAVMTGVGISVVTASISGLFAPYSSLPPILQKFSRVYPISSANSLIIYFLLGKSYMAYNPLSVNQVTTTIILSFLLFAVGLILYSEFCWRKE